MHEVVVRLGGPERVDPHVVYGTEPDAPVAYLGWGEIPDQHGRRWEGDDGSGAPPPRPDPPTSDLPPILPHWGDRQARSFDDRVATPTLRDEWDDASWRGLRGAVHRGDGAAVVDLLRRHDPVEAAQLAGDGLLIALEQGVEGADVLARRLADAIRGRYLPGDEELVEELDAARGAGPPSELQPVPVDLDELATHLEGGDYAWEGWRLDVETGQWWPDDPVGLIGEEPPDHWEDPDRWLLPTSFGSRAGWEDMRDFIGHVRDDELAGRLERAIHGRGAFRYFKDVLAEREGMLQAWYRFSEERQRGRARQWLALEGHRPARAATSESSTSEPGEAGPGPRRP